MEKTYKIELDVLASAGKDAIKRVGQKGNIAYIDFDELADEADNSANRNQFELQRVLDYTNQLMRGAEVNDGRYSIPTGGSITDYDAGHKEISSPIHITRNPSKTSRFLRDGTKVEWPDFLRYGTETLSEGIIDIEFPGDPTSINLEQILEISKRDSLFNNQHIRVNRSIVYLAREKLKKSKDIEKYTSTEEMNLERITNLDTTSNSRLPGFKAYNMEQLLGFNRAIDSKNVEVMFITGGSGKSVVAYAAALNSILGTEKERRDKEILENIVLFKSNDIVGGRHREMGHLPGSEFQKSLPFMKSFADAHKLCGINAGEMPFKEMLSHPEVELDGFEKRERDKIGEFYLPKRTAAIEIENLQFARGRTFTSFGFIDEAQNYSPHEMKQLLERFGDGSRILIVGDPKQIDNERDNLDENFNGLVYAANIFYGNHPRVAFIDLDKNYRSQTADIMRQHEAPMSIR